MAIQQSINQLLQSTQFAAALYAHQPDVQQQRAEKRELRNLTAEMEEAEKFAAEHPLRPATAKEKEKYLSQQGLTPEAVDKAGDVDPDELTEIIDIYEAKTPGKSATLHSPQSWAQMKARRRQLDPEYREQQYQQEIGRRKTVEKMEEFLQGKINLEQFKEEVGI